MNKMEDLINMTKLNDLLNKKEVKEKKASKVVWIFAIIGIIAATPAAKVLIAKVKESDGAAAKVTNLLECIAIPALLIICTAYLVDGSFNPFLYFRF